MSHRRPPRPSRLASLRELATPDTCSSQLLPADLAPSQRRPWGASDLVILPEHPLREGEIDYVQAREPMRLEGFYPGSDIEPPQAQRTVWDFDDFQIVHSDGPGPGGEVDGSRMDENRAKKVQQWTTWQKEVVPSLVQPYLQILRRTNSLRDTVFMLKTCPNNCQWTRLLDVLCVSFQSECVLSKCCCFLWNVFWALLVMDFLRECENIVCMY